ncbi:hypothetical protein BDN67DRAFT_960512 [Paxillus ammoniavirescens]|nr:hypothetical protein BDN67DRAFT_960512 [Paxillus ammoniavirescens]
MYDESSYYMRYTHPNVQIYEPDHSFSEYDILISPHPSAASSFSYLFEEPRANTPFLEEPFSPQEVPSGTNDPLDLSSEIATSTHREETVFPSDDFSSTTHSGSGVPEGIPVLHHDPSDSTPLPLSSHSELSEALGANVSRQGHTGPGSLQHFSSVESGSHEWHVNWQQHAGGANNNLPFPSGAGDVIPLNKPLVPSFLNAPSDHHEGMALPGYDYDFAVSNAYSRSVVTDGTTTPRRVPSGVLDTNSLSCQDPSGPGSLPGFGCGINHSLRSYTSVNNAIRIQGAPQVQSGSHGRDFGQVERVDDTGNDLLLSAPMSRSHADRYDLQPPVVRATTWGRTSHLDTPSPGSQLPPSLTISQVSHGLGRSQLDPRLPSHAARQGVHRGTANLTLRPTRSMTYPPHNSSPYPNMQAGPYKHSSETIPKKCGWRATDGSTCEGSITGATISEHLVQHGITDMAYSVRIECRWCPDGKKPIKRESIVRHVREVHMRLKRPPKSRAGSSALMGSPEFFQG